LEKEKPRLARLTAILTQLQAKRIVTATELAKKHGVSVRTIYRDMRTLELSGVPLFTEEGKGYSLVAGYQLPPVMLTEAEANALITAEQIINNNTDQSFRELYQSATTKFKAVLKQSEKEKTTLLAERLQIRTNHEDQKTSDYLIRLQSTLVNFQVVHLHYHSLEKKRTERMVEPFALYSANDNWVLIAFCQLKQAFRAFRLDCIEQLHITDKTFEPHKMTLEEYFEACRKSYSTPDIPLTT